MARKPNATITFQIRISPELNDKIIAESEKKGESKTAAAVRIMELYFKEREEGS